MPALPIGRFLLAAFLAACADSPPAALPQPEVLATGADSRVDVAECVRMRSLDELRRTWNRHVGRAANAPGDAPAGMPQVDFAQHEVLAIFGGKGANSRGLHVVEILDEGSVRRVRFDSMSYQTASFAGESGRGFVAVQDYGFFLLPRTTQTLVVEEDVQGTIGQPPVWKLRARL